MPLAIFGLAAAAAIFALIVWLARTSAQKTEANLTDLALRLGLTLTATRVFGLISEAELNGMIDGRRVRFWSYTTGAGKSRKSWVAVGVRPRQETALEFSFLRRGFATGIAQLFGAKKIMLGDRKFDDAWFIKTNQAEFLTAALVPTIREKLLAVHAGSRTGKVRLEKGEVSFSEVGGFSSREQLVRLEAAVPVLLDLADVAEVLGKG